MDGKNLIHRYSTNYGLDETRITGDLVMSHWNLERGRRGCIPIRRMKAPVC